MRRVLLAVGVACFGGAIVLVLASAVAGADSRGRVLWVAGVCMVVGLAASAFEAAIGDHNERGD